MNTIKRLLTFLTIFFFVALLPFGNLGPLGNTGAFAADREISVKGSSEFKIKIEGEKVKLKGDKVDGNTLAAADEGWSIKDSKGETIAWLKSSSSGEVSLGNEAEHIFYDVKFQDQGYSVFLQSGELLNRVKVKEDKFNLYNKDAQRLLHGKQKEDGYGVKDEKGTQVIKIKGVNSLKEASYFALQVSPQVQALLWAQEYLN